MKILFGSDISFEYKDGGITPENASERVSSVKPVFDAADFRMVNLENVLYDSQEGEIIKSGPALRSSRSCVSFLKALGIDTVGLANNHFGDFGDRGMSSTLECLEQNGISYVGAGKNIDEAYRSHVFEKDGISVSVIAACENEFGTASAEGMGSAGYESLRLADRISEERKRADFVVVYFHGGNERDPYPSPGKNDLYRLWTRLGADAVIAMHTHCPQGFEIFEEKPIVYSMGNLYFPGEPESYAAEPDSSWFFGYLTELDFSENGISVKTYPYRFGSVNEPLLLLSGSEKEAFDRYVGDHCPCFVPREKVTPAQAVELILGAGGVPVLAHPILYHMSDERLDNLVAELKSIGLAGIEAIYSTYNTAEERQIRKLASKYNLKISGGSDFHGANKPKIDLGTGWGKLYVPDEVLENLRPVLR